MALVIRLKRMGKTKAPFYRIVVADERRAAKGGKYIEEVGYYSPLKEPPDIKVNSEKVLEWIKKGAKITETVKSIIKKTDIYKTISKMKNIEK
ncbi:MAG: 30S ribosomal protein S16 [Candidatus Goldbacteria bacterium]|nr:30S ribosomal protein S16 [Candidatus Goldiibacteriota bacterium]